MISHPTAEAIRALFREPHPITRPPITTIADADRWLQQQSVHPDVVGSVFPDAEPRMHIAYRLLLVVWLRAERGLFCEW